jgi:hypothetical protein
MTDGGRGVLWRVLFPDVPRRIPGQRVVNIAMRTAHLVTFGILVGGHVFDVESSRLFPFLLATIVTGAGLMVLELASTCAWLFMGKGAAIVLKLMLLLMVPLFWQHRVALMLAVVVLASASSHMPSRFRYYSFLSRRRVELPERRWHHFSPPG